MIKNFLILLTISVITCVIWSLSGFWKFSREYYISQKVLEMSRPVGGKIDIEFLKRFEPANEQ